MTTSVERSPEHAPDLTLRQLRKVALGALAVIATVDALSVPVMRWRERWRRIANDVSPLDKPSATLIALVADVLNGTDGLSRSGHR
jgi:hypothetical protein